MEGLEGGGKQSGGKWGKCVRAALRKGSQNLPSAKHQQGWMGYSVKSFIHMKMLKNFTTGYYGSL